MLAISSRSTWACRAISLTAVAECCMILGKDIAGKPVIADLTRMICYGASSYNLCFLVPADQAEQVVQKLHQNLFE